MKRVNLCAFGVALLLSCAALAAGAGYAGSVEHLYVHALAPDSFSLKNKGSALQQMAFQQGDLLPVYGSSEIYIMNTSYEESRLFARYPTGFAPFDVGDAGGTSLMTAEKLAAVGPYLRGKKVVISFTPTMFFDKMAGKKWMDLHFSPLQVSALAFSTQLDYRVRQDAARRILQYPETLRHEFLLSVALRRLASASLFDRLLYGIIWPLGKLHNLVLRLQDHWEFLAYVREHADLRPQVERQAKTLDWPALLAKAEEAQKKSSSNNPFGFDNREWQHKYRDIVSKEQTLTDKKFLRDLNRSLEWTDLDILLRVSRDLGARPLLLSRPINGVYWGYLGVSQQARDVYYQKLRQVAAHYGVAVRDFQEHDRDPYFSIDPSSHTSREGWVYVDQVLDAFFHDTLEKQ
jgi:D-alanine transfer protein